jgi:hypothetical protein
MCAEFDTAFIPGAHASFSALLPAHTANAWRIDDTYGRRRIHMRWPGRIDDAYGWLRVVTVRGPGRTDEV